MKLILLLLALVLFTLLSSAVTFAGIVISNGILNVSTADEYGHFTIYT